MSFTSFLTDFNLVVVGLVAAFIAGVGLSTKIKDFVSGVPSAARTAFNNVEAQAIADVKQAQADVISKLPGAAPAPKVALAASAAPLVAAAPAPAPTVAAQPATPQAV